MKDFSVEWRGSITRDVGWSTVRAETLEIAKTKFAQVYGWTRVIVSVSEITDLKYK